MSKERFIYLQGGRSLPSPDFRHISYNTPIYGNDKASTYYYENHKRVKEIEEGIRALLSCALSIPLLSYLSSLLGYSDEKVNIERITVFGYDEEGNPTRETIPKDGDPKRVKEVVKTEDAGKSKVKIKEIIDIYRSSYPLSAGCCPPVYNL